MFVLCEHLNLSLNAYLHYQSLHVYHDKMPVVVIISIPPTVIFIFHESMISAQMFKLVNIINNAFLS